MFYQCNYDHNIQSGMSSILQYIAAAHYSTYMTEEFVNNRFGALDPGKLQQAGNTGCNLLFISLAAKHKHVHAFRMYSAIRDVSLINLYTIYLISKRSAIWKILVIY